MLETLPQLVVLAVALTVMLAIIRAAVAAQYTFMVVIRRGELHVTKGHVPAEFLDHVREVCGEHAITSGWIGGVQRGKNTALKFSRQIPRPIQQRLRNYWFVI
jgi:hypothetical protein